MKKRIVLATIAAASSLLVTGAALYAADSNANWDKETVGEKIDDATITSKVKMQLMSNKATSAMHTEVDTTGGVVTLTGKAGSRAEKELATELAQKVKGVTRVNNQMTIDTTR